MPEVVVGRCHGGWNPDDAYAQVPANTTVYLYLDSFRVMHPDDADHSTMLDVDGLKALQSQASQTITEYRTLPNYSISKLSDDDVVLEGPLHEGVVCVQEDGLYLKDILTQYSGNNIYWFACQAVQLYEETSQPQTVNQMQRF